MSKQLEMEVKVGIFVTIGTALIALAILVLGSSENLLTRKVHYTAHFPNVDGLITGAKVVLGGLQVGTVNGIAFDMDKRDIRVDFTVSKDSAAWIRKDSGAEIATQGVLGDKYIAITAGNMDQPEMPADAEIPNRPSKSLTQFLSKGDQLLVNLNNLVSSLDRMLKTFEAQNRSERFFEGMAKTANNLSLASDKLNHELDDFKLKRISKNLDSILEKINNGTGTIGALINDPALYDDAKKLVGEANHNRIVRNLVRQTLKDADKTEKGKKPSPTPKAD